MLLGTGAVHATGLWGAFVFDDHGVLPAPPASIGAWLQMAHGLRPLLKLSYGASAAAGPGPTGFHLFNLAVHLVAVFLVMALAEAATSPASRWPFRLSSAAPIAAGLLFGLHPVQTEAVTYVSGRSSSLMACPYLAALLCHVQGVRRRRPLEAARQGVARVEEKLGSRDFHKSPTGL